MVRSRRFLPRLLPGDRTDSDQVRAARCRAVFYRLHLLVNSAQLGHWDAGHDSLRRTARYMHVPCHDDRNADCLLLCGGMHCICLKSRAKYRGICGVQQFSPKLTRRTDYSVAPTRDAL